MEQPNTPKKPTIKPSSSMLPTSLAIIAIIITAVIAFYFLQGKKQLNTLAQKQQQTAAGLMKIQQQQQQLLTEQKQALAGYAKTLQQALKKHQASANQWAIANAIYLSRLANYKLNFEHNIPATIAILQNADNELRNSNNANVLKARDALHKDISALQSLPVLNNEDIYLKLSAIDEQIKHMPILAARNTTKLVKAKQVPASNWRDGLHKSWQSLKGLIVIRHHAETEAALISPKQATALQENLHELISQTQIALLHHQGRIYHDNLNRAIHWLNTYFIGHNPVVEQTLKTLTQLNAINIAPKLPDISRSINALNALTLKEEPQA